MRIAILSMVMAAALLAQDAKQDSVIVITGVKIDTVSKGVIENGTVVIRNGRIEKIGGSVAIPKGARVIRPKSGSSVTPGFIDLHSHLGAVSETDETTEAFTPHVKIQDAYSTREPRINPALGSGVTSYVLMPGSANVISGQPALIRLSGERLDKVILDGSLGLKIVFTQEALAYDRVPTSTSWAVRLLQERLRDSSSVEYGLLIREKRIAFLHARTSDEIVRAVKLAEEFKLKAVLVHADEVGRVLDRVKASRIPVAFGPLRVDSTEKMLQTPARLAKAGIRFGFVSDAPDTSESHLRVSAALAVKYGLGRADALKALTLWPAKMLGLRNAGALEVGKTADLVVLSGGAVSLTSRITHVIAGGKLVYQRKEGSK